MEVRVDEPRVVFEDDSVIGVIKPARMHCAPGPGGRDLCAWVFERYPDAGAVDGRGIRGGAPPEDGGSRLEGGLLHRLDYDTSGLVLFARSPESFRSLLFQQAEGHFRKEYLAFSSASSERHPEGSRPGTAAPGGAAEGAWADARGRLDAGSLAAQLARGASDRGRFIACGFRAFGPKGARVACLGRASLLEGREAGRAGGPTYRSEILECEARGALLGSGREAVRLRIGIDRGFRHQIRAQLAWIGLPISGDPLYGGAPDDRLRLYAVRLAFARPATGAPVSLVSEVEEAAVVAFRPGLR